MKQLIFTFAAAACLVGTAFGQVKINEIGTMEPGTDNNEFVELYGPGGASLNSYELAFINGNGGVSYDIIDLAGQTIPPDGYFVIAGVASAVPNQDMTDPNGPATNWLQNGDPDVVVLREKATGAAIDSVVYFTLYNGAGATPVQPVGSPNHDDVPTSAIETQGAGAGGDDNINFQTGTATVVTVRNDISFGRYPDGHDTNNNHVDFTNLYLGRTPGTSNATGINNTVPFTESFNAGVGLTRQWLDTFTPIRFETAATAAPASMPNSPDTASPAEWAAVKDPTGGGEQSLIIDFLAQDYYVEAFVYAGAISTSTDATATEYGGLTGRMNMGPNNANSTWQETSPYGHGYGESLYGLSCGFTTGTVEAIKVQNAVRTVVASTPVSVGWHKLAMNFKGARVDYFVNGTFLAQLPAETPREGYVGVGYRENYISTSSSSLGTVRTNFDALKITAPLTPSGINEWSLY